MVTVAVSSSLCAYSVKLDGKETVGLCGVMDSVKHGDTWL